MKRWYDFNGNELPPMNLKDWAWLIAVSIFVLGWWWAIIWYVTK